MPVALDSKGLESLGTQLLFLERSALHVLASFAEYSIGSLDAQV